MPENGEVVYGASSELVASFSSRRCGSQGPWEQATASYGGGTARKMREALWHNVGQQCPSSPGYLARMLPLDRRQVYLFSHYSSMGYRDLQNLQPAPYKTSRLSRASSPFLLEHGWPG